MTPIETTDLMNGSAEFTSSLRTLTLPHCYYQGWGIRHKVAELLVKKYRNLLLISDRGLPAFIEKDVGSALRDAGVEYQSLYFDGEVTWKNIVSNADEIESSEVSVVLGLGGGKTVDFAKGISHLLEKPFISMPTIASNDGAISRTIAIYDDDGLLVSTPQMKFNPNYVIVDTELICGASTQYLRSGIGDALAKKFEVEAAVKAAKRDGRFENRSLLPRLIARECYKVIRSKALEVLSAQNKEPSSSLEDLVESIVLLSGVAFENGGLSIAHASTRGLMRIPGARDFMHGYHVAYGLLLQLAIEQNSMIWDIHEFLGEVGLPRSLAELNAELNESAIESITRAVMESPHRTNYSLRVDESMVAEAMGRLERTMPDPIDVPSAPIPQDHESSQVPLQ